MAMLRGVCFLQGYKLQEMDLWEASNPGRAVDGAGMIRVRTGLAKSVRQFISSSKTLVPAVLLLMHFKDVGVEHFSPDKLMGQLVAKGQSRLAEEWAQLLGYEFQVGWAHILTRGLQHLSIAMDSMHH